MNVFTLRFRVHTGVLVGGSTRRSKKDDSNDVSHFNMFY